MHTKFEVEKINELLAHYHDDNNQNRHSDLPLSITNYDDFVNKLPIIYDDDFRQKAIELLNLKLLKQCSFTMSSATSSAHKMLAQSIWRSVTPESYPFMLVNTLLRSGVFSSDDVVANLFSAGGMSTLYDGCNRLLEGCKASILPIGRLDANPGLIKTFLEVMSNTGVNVLFGTPSSINQCTRLSSEHNSNLEINKIVFTGEMFSDIKRAFVLKHFPKAQIFGLYGHSETGFIGLTTPKCNKNYYHLLSNFFFVETTSKGEILVTDLTKPLIPLFRYYVGDIGELIMDHSCECGSDNHIIFLKDRCDKKFNYMGNLISYTNIKSIVNRNFKTLIGVQVQLSTDNLGRDILSVVIDVDEPNLDLVKQKILDDLTSLDDIREGLERKTGSLVISSQSDLIYSVRQKMPMIYDCR